jgi:hypothetical protein
MVIVKGAAKSPMEEGIFAPGGRMNFSGRHLAAYM